MAERIKGLQIDLSLNDIDISKGLSNVKREFRALNTSMKVSNNNFKFGDKSAKSYRTRMQELGVAVDGSKKHLDQLKREHDAVSKAQGANSKEALNLSNEINRETDTLNMYQDQLKNVTGEYKQNFSVAGKLGKSFSSLGAKITGTSKQISGIGKSLTTRLTTPIVAGFGASIKAAVDYEQALAGVQKTTNLSGGEMKKMSKEITDMSNTMPFAATEVAGVAEAAGQLGVKKKDITGFTKTMLDMSVATNLTSDEAATAFARFANAMGMPMNKVDRLGSAVVALGNNTATTESEIVEMGQRLAGAGAQAGFSADQVMGISAAMSSVGINAEAGGTAMTQIFNKMTKASADGGDELNAFAKTSGMSAKEFASTWEKNPTEALQAFVKGLSETKGGASGVIKALDDVGITGIREADTIRRLANNHKVLDKALDTSAKGWKDNTALSKEAETRYKTLGSQLKVLKNNLMNFGKEIGATIAPIVETLTNKLTKLIQGFQGMNLKSKQMIVIFGGIAAAIGPALMAIGSMGQGLGYLTSGVGNLLTKIAGSGGLSSAFSALTGPIGITVAIIGALGAAFAVAYKKSETFRDIVNGAFNAVKDTLSNVWTTVIQPVLTSIGSMFSGVWKQIKNAADIILPDLKTGFSQSFGVIKGVVSDLSPIFTQTFSYIKDVINTVLPGIKSMFSNTFKGIKDIVSGAFSIILGLVKVFAGLFSGNFSHMWEGIQQIFGGAIRIIVGLFRLSFAGQIVAFTKGMWKQLKAAFTNIWKGITKIFTNLKNGVVKIWETMKNAVVKKAKSLWSGAKNVFNAMKKGISNIFNGIKNTAVKIWNAIKNTVVKIVKTWWSNVKHNFNAMKSGITKIFNGVKNTVVKIWDTIKSKVSGLVGGMKKSVVGTVGKMRDGIKGIVDKIKGYFTGMVKAVKKGLNKLIDGVNWVGGKLGMKKLGKIKLSTGTEDTTVHNVVTNGKINRDTFATVGDKGKGNGPRGFRQEMIRYPNGKFAMTPNKDTTAYLPKGSSVFNGQQTYNAMHGLPQFAGGTWDKIKGAASNAWSKTKETVGKGAGWLKNKVGDVMDYVSHPGKLLDKVLKAFGVNFDFINGSLPKNLMSGMFGKLKTAAKELIQTWLESADGGEFDGKMGKHGVYKYLWDIAQKVMKKFPGMRYTSGYRKGDPNSHGKHQAVDIAYPASDNHSSKYFKPANWAFDNFKKQIAYVITQGKVKDRSGKSGQGKSGNWKHWPDNDHYDHLHLNGMWGPGDIAKNPGGKGVKRWRSYVQKALKKNGLTASKGHVNSWLSQVNTESSGNPNAVQGYIPGDPNNGNPARGLLQTIPSTFKAHAFKGHKNIMNGYDSILAAIHYAKSRYGKNGMYQVIGHGHGYATGGLINTPGWYNLSERGFGEYVIPTDPSKQSDAMKLLAIASQQISKKDKNKRPNQMRVPGGNASTQQDKDNRELNQKLNTLISMFGQLLGLNSAQLQAIKDGASDKTQFYKQQSNDMRMSQYQSL